ncbi:MAG: hypothetical protein ACO307_16575 [Ilumatobacteraceae bacterium]
MPRVHASRSCIVTHNGVALTVREGQPFDVNDPIVADLPWLFETDVEEATARPGERRQTRRKPS